MPFVRSSLRKEGVSLFNDMFPTTSHHHNHITRGSANHLLNLLNMTQEKVTHFGDYSIRSTASNVLSNLYGYSNCNLFTSKITEFRNSIQKIFLNKYDNDN